MKVNIAIIALVMLNISFAQKDTSTHETVNTQIKSLTLPKIQVVPITDTNTKREYELYIKLPEGYSKDKETTYPVLYYTDALWHVELISGSTEYLTEDLILVGISWQKGENPSISRYRDYTMLKDMHPKYQSGDASNHLKFIKNQVFTYIENHYRAKSENKSYYGYSLGGTFGAYILFTQPETFTNYILGSPGTLSDDSNIYEHKSISVQNLKEADLNIFISHGEEETKDLIQHTKGLVSTINNLDNKNIVLKYITIPKADHSQAFPMSTLKSMYWLVDVLK